MKGCVLIRKGHGYLHIRFEEMGSRKRFNALLQAFRNTFPLAWWDDEERAWCLPTAQFDNIVTFAKTFLGTHAIKVQKDPTPVTAIRQMQLFR